MGFQNVVSMAFRLLHVGPPGWLLQDVWMIPVKSELGRCDALTGEIVSLSVSLFVNTTMFAIW